MRSRFAARLLLSRFALLFYEFTLLFYEGELIEQALRKERDAKREILSGTRSSGYDVLEGVAACFSLPAPRGQRLRTA